MVIGASIAGLMAGRVLADHYTQVTVLERDRLPDAPTPRNGVPQSRHTHVLLVRGRQIMEDYFPGLIGELTAAGATLFDSSADARFLTPLGWLPRLETGLISVACTRGLIEWHLHGRLAQRRNVRFVEEAEAIGLMREEGQPSTRAGVSGVSVRSRASGSANQDAFAADLVVDASGRSSRAADWLASLGRQKPRESVVNSYVGYATRLYAQPEGERDWLIATLQAHPPQLTRAGVILPIEAGRWIVTLVGYVRDYPPTDEVGFMEFARTLASPLIFDSLQRATPVSPIAGYRRTENYMRHFEQVRDWPEGFVVIGDAVCGFNPAYGQGMTNAAIGATILDEILHEGKPDFEGEFQRRLARHNGTPWLLATNEDFRFPQTEGQRPGALTRLIQRYIDRLFIASMQNTEIFEAFMAVVHMLKGPGYLFRPRIAAKVMWHTLMSRLGVRKR